MILLNPGPVTLSDRVRAALVREDLCHREPEFAELCLDLRRRLERVYAHAANGHAAVLLTASGTAAVEAMLTSLVPRTAATLVVANGVYGERMATMLARRQRPHELIRANWLDPIPLDAVEAALARNPAIRFVACVHHETTTGRLNAIDALGQLCRSRGVGLLLDAVSSFGAEIIRFSEWNLLAAAAAGNKCLHGVPGTAFVLARADAIEACAGNADAVYLDLHDQFRLQRDGWSPFTQNVQGFFALQEALREFEEAGGRAARFERYARLSSRVRRDLVALGARQLVPESACSSMLTAFRLPPGTAYGDLHDGLRRAGFTIYGGQGQLAADIFRVATMGAITDADIDRFGAACRALLSGGAPR